MYNNLVYIADSQQHFRPKGFSGTDSYSSVPASNQAGAGNADGLNVTVIFAAAVAVFVITAVIIIMLLLSKLQKRDAEAAKAARLRELKRKAKKQQLYGSSSADYSENTDDMQTFSSEMPEKTPDTQDASAAQEAEPVKMGTPESIADCIKSFLDITKDI